MKNINAQLTDKLEIEGVNANGYGILPKIVMQDTRLTIEAKAIYAYIVSYAGAGSTAFPSLKKILADLQIGENRFYKHRKSLIDCNYITVKQIKNEKNEIIKNIYTLVANPKIEETERNEGGILQNEGYPIPQNEGYPIPQNEGHIINRFKINKLKDDDDNNSHSANLQVVKVNQEKTTALTPQEELLSLLLEHAHLKSFAVALFVAGVSPADCLEIVAYLSKIQLTPLVSDIIQSQLHANAQEAQTNGLTNYKAYFLTGLRQKLANAEIVAFLMDKDISTTDPSFLSKQDKILVHDWVTT